MKRRGIGLLLVLLAVLCFALPAQAEAKGKKKLSAPKITKVSLEKQGIKIKWKKVRGAAKYRVFCKTGGKWRRIADTKSTSYTWKQAVSGSSYKFRVRCITKKGKRYTSGYSKASKTYRYLSAPVITGLANTTKGVMINWSPVKGAKKYRIFYKSGSKWKKIKDTASTGYVWKKAKDGKKYTITVRCINASGNKYTSAYYKTGATIEAHKPSIKFSSSTQTVNVGSSGMLSVTGDKGTSYRYASSNPAVLRVSGDRYEAVSGGTADVTCTMTLCDGGTVACTCRFTVIEFSQEYMSGRFYQRLKAAQLTGNYREDMIAVALSQVGYYEGNTKTQLSGEYPGSKNYTEYGRYYGTVKTAWCSEFASWCARRAHVPLGILGDSRVASPTNFGSRYYRWNGTVYGGGEYMPQKGDLLLVANEDKDINDSYMSHTAIINEVEEIKEEKKEPEEGQEGQEGSGTGETREDDSGNGEPEEENPKDEEPQVTELHIHVIHGNVNKCVQTGYYIVDAATGDITGYKRDDAGMTGKTAKAAYIVAPNYEAN